jgi:hypothetical protein
MVYIGSGGEAFVRFVRAAYTIVFCAALVCVEVYAFPFFKYFGVLLKMWGKAIMYLFVGALLYWNSGFGLACAIIYWILAVAFGIAGYFFRFASLPLMQRAGNPPDVGVSSSQIYEGQGQGQSQTQTQNQGRDQELAEPSPQSQEQTP